MTPMTKSSNNGRHAIRTSRVPLITRLDHISPIFDSFYIEEPKLLFAGGETSVDPKAGLDEHGPVSSEVQAGRIINVGIVATPEGVQQFLSFLEQCRIGINAGFNSRNKPLDPLNYPRFPGCGETQTFRAHFVSHRRDHHRTIHEEHFSRALRGATEEIKIKNVVQLILTELSALSALDPAPDVVVILLPRDVEHEVAHVGAAFAGRRLQLTPKEKFLNRLEKESARTGQEALGLEFDDGEDAASGGFYNIHHALKARAMSTNLPTQLMWESTLNDPHLSQIAWNVLTALYYKAGQIPWRLLNMPDDTCFVGISFFKEKPFANADMQSSLAQVFGAGEGLVLQGDRALRDTTRGDGQPHLAERTAENLLRRALDLYTQQHKSPPRRVVIHKTSRYWEEEIRGILKALGNIPRHDLLAIDDKSDFRFMRTGKKPVLRGTAVFLEERRYLLFTNGYIPYLRSYPSKRIPRPLEITEHFGHSTAYVVCQELLALTKLNWNSCAFGSSKPITIRFSREVGKILAEVPRDQAKSVQTKYRFFM